MVMNVHVVYFSKYLHLIIESVKESRFGRNVSSSCDETTKQKQPKTNQKSVSVSLLFPTFFYGKKYGFTKKTEPSDRMLAARQLFMYSLCMATLVHIYIYIYVIYNRKK